jgi:hypothetical protein
MFACLLCILAANTSGHIFLICDRERVLKVLLDLDGITHVDSDGERNGAKFTSKSCAPRGPAQNVKKAILRVDIRLNNT